MNIIGFENIFEYKDTNIFVCENEYLNIFGRFNSNREWFAHLWFALN